jgi:mono/diheme cytochrome c family protein
MLSHGLSVRIRTISGSAGFFILALPVLAAAIPAWLGVHRMDVGALQQAPAESEERLARGGTLYSKHCAACHGPTGAGDGEAGRDLDPRPSNLCDSDVVSGSDAKLFRQITRGRRPMPAFARLLNEDDRWILVGYVKSLAASGERGKAR